MKKLTCFKPVKVIYEGDMVIEIGEKEEIQQETKEYKEEPMKDIRIDMNHQSIYFDMNDIHSYNKFENDYNTLQNNLFQQSSIPSLSSYSNTANDILINQRNTNDKETKELTSTNEEIKEIKRKEKIEKKEKKEQKEKKPKKEEITDSFKQKVSIEEEKKFPKVRVTLEAFEELQQFRKKYKCKSYCEVVNKLLNIYDSIQHHDNK